MPDGITPPAGDQNAENSTIKLMREQIDAANLKAQQAEDARKAAATAQSELEAKLQTIERAKLDETERLRLEKEDADKKVSELAPLRDEVGKYASAFENLYNERIAALPADKQETAKALSAAGTWADRYETLQKIGTLLGAAPATGGTITKPVGGAPAPGSETLEPAAPLKPTEIRRTSWSTALRSRPNTAPQTPKTAHTA